MIAQLRTHRDMQDIVHVYDYLTNTPQYLISEFI